MQDLRKNRKNGNFSRLPDALTFGLVITCGILLAQLTWLIFPADPTLLQAGQPQSPNNMALSEGVQILKAKAPRVNQGDELARYHLFGQVQLASNKPIEPKPTPTKPKKIAKPRTPIELAGIYVLPGKQALAVLTIRGEQEVFSVGEPLVLFPGSEKEQDLGAVLKSVSEQEVIIAWNDGDQTLTLKEDEDPTPSRSLASNNNTPINNRATPLKTSSINNQTTNSPQDNVGNTAAQANLSQFREQVMTDNRRLLDMVRPSPVNKNGKLIGFRVTPGRNMELFRSSGLFGGDIVTEINGIPLNDLNASMQALQNLSTSGTITLKVLRSGQEVMVQRSF